ncbi:MAG TPA: DinB family protein [Thermoanaerobaculia bacterium]|nr:DinB family protein [Thermoanaerobaculia bacterium]
MIKIRLAVGVLALLLPVMAFAQNAAKPQSAKKLTGFRGEFLANLDEVQEKLTDLAQSVPAEKYSWRPAPGVRSISEVYMHVAGGNYFLTSFLGVKPPATRDLEKEVTAKADVLVEMKKSFDFLRASVSSLSDAELEKAVKLFGTQTTERGVLVTILSHLHEHLGQSVAYARMNGVVPPWSR